MAGNVAPSPVFHWSLSSGAPAVGYKVYAYESGSTTPLDTYNDDDLAPGHENTNPVVLDSGGNAVIYLKAQAYKLVIKTDADVTVQTIDPVYPIALGTTGVTLTGSETLTNKTLTAPIISTISNTGTLTLPTSTDTLVGRATTDTLTNKTLTSPVINTPTVKALTEVVSATNVITAAETGSVFFLSSATEFVSTLPAVAAGLQFTFIVSAAPSGASYTVVAASGTPIIGHTICSQDAGGTADSETSGVLTVTFVDSKAVKGDKAVFVCDGTNWYCTATCKVFDAITFS